MLSYDVLTLLNGLGWKQSIDPYKARNSVAVKLVTKASHWRKIGKREEKKKSRGEEGRVTSVAGNSERFQFSSETVARYTGSCLLGAGGTGSENKSVVDRTRAGGEFGEGREGVGGISADAPTRPRPPDDWRIMLALFR
ncbi:hypothetical protein EVAR_838_1 [Eumeta japonica]|uniref:Uncharacterized protein n=1 Tax=Eumeta variegata TaxID=151549 RepID=A0A4C1SDG3_EUMVA|nr:hypothetical protein EVAR_838_1 [Eumeta japonica]